MNSNLSETIRIMREYNTQRFKLLRPLAVNEFAVYTLLCKEGGSFINYSKALSNCYRPTLLTK